MLRPELADLTAYAPRVPEAIRIRLDANESPAIQSSLVKEAVMRAIGKVALERYPDARATELRERVAERTGAKPNELLFGTGSDEVIALLVNACARPRDRMPQPTMLVPSPTFVMYRATARAHGTKVIEVPLDAAWDIDVGQTLRAVEMMRPNVIFLASPNNPTGNRFSTDRIERVLDAARDAFVVVDEAYADFAGESLRGWRARYENLGILRTLSKLGLAALRIGWLEAHEDVVREIDKGRQPFNTSATSQAAAAAVLSEGWNVVRAHVEGIVAERDRVSAAMKAVDGVEPAPSAANFLWVRSQKPADAVAAGLAARGILVRGFHASGGRLAHQVRITIGTRAENDEMLAALTECAR
jgi:histidinol-phosphate aminotransferase